MLIRTIGILTDIGIGLAFPAAAAPSQPIPNSGQTQQAGYCDIPQSGPMYESSQDREGDGMACEC